MVILICYDGSADAQAAIGRAGVSMPGSDATILVIWERSGTTTPVLGYAAEPGLLHRQLGQIDRGLPADLTGSIRELLTLMQSAARRLRDRVIWNVNSTANRGGGVELLRLLFG